MTILKLNNFTGMIPRLPDERLPDGAASLAINADFRYGELRSLKGAAPRINTTGAVRALFTDDGLRFYAWPAPARAYLSPTFDDTHARVYYQAQGDSLRVAQMTGAYVSNPRPPATSWAVGVARPTAAPTLALVNVAAFAGDTGATAKFYATCNLAGAETSRTSASITETQTRWKQYTVAVPESPCASQTAGGSAQALGPIAPAGGYVAGPDVATIYLEGEASTGANNSVVNVTRVRSAGKWRVSSGGSLQWEEGSNWAVPSVVNGAKVSVLFQGRMWVTMTQLYNALRDGTTATATTGVSSAASPTTDATKILSDAEIGFVFEVLGTDGTVLYSTKAIGTKTGEGVYSVTVPYESADKVTVSYVTVFENTWGEESAPSDPVVIDVLPFETVRIRQAYTGLSGGRPVQGMNVYRTYPGTNAEYFLVNAAPSAAVVSGAYQFDDTSKRVATSTRLESAEWDAPPSNLHSLTYAGNGFFAGASGKDLRFSEPYRPHAWPYFMTLPYSITGIVEVEGGVLVTTTGQPYLVYGPHPEQMSQQVMNAEQEGVSSRAMTRVEGSAVYASNDGLVTVSGGQASLAATQQLFTRNDWRAKYKAALRNMALLSWDGMVLGVVDPSYPVAGVSGDNFILRLDEQPSYSLLQIPGATVVGGGISRTTDTMYLGYTNGYAEFGIGADLALTWWSKVFEYPRPVCFGAVVVDLTGTFSLQFYADGALIHAQGVTTGETAFRLPSASPQKKWQVRITGTGVVRRIEMGASFQELQDG